MKTKRRNVRWRLALIATVGSLFGVGMLAGPAEAIIGRPLTPLSFAGVARRTTRRAVYAGAAAGAYGYAAAPYPYAAPPPSPAYYW